MDVAATNPDIIEWNTFDECIEYIHTSGNPFISFVSPTRLASLATQLLRAAFDLPNLFSIIFGFPRIDFEVSGSNLKGRLDERVVFTRVFGNNCDFTARFTGEFARVLEGDDMFSHWQPYQKELEKHIMDDRIVKNTVLFSEKWVTYSRMADNSLATYSIGFGAQISLTLLTQIDSKLTETFFDPKASMTVQDRALATFLLARCVATDRYCKRCIFEWQSSFSRNEPAPISPSGRRWLRMYVSWQDRMAFRIHHAC